MEQQIQKIAILHCRKSGNVCTGAACFRSFYDRKKAFEQYQGQNVELSAYFDCNGCEADKLTDPGERRAFAVFTIGKRHLNSTKDRMWNCRRTLTAMDARQISSPIRALRKKWSA